LDLIAPNLETWQLWVHGIIRLIILWREETPLNQYPFLESFIFRFLTGFSLTNMLTALRPYWKETKLNQSGLERILHHMNLSKKRAKELLKRCGLNLNKHPLTFREFSILLEKRLWNYPPIKEIYKSFVGTQLVMTDQEFLQFLESTQQVIFFVILTLKNL
jgi:hypothetical protein